MDAGINNSLVEEEGWSCKYQDDGVTRSKLREEVQSGGIEQVSRESWMKRCGAGCRRNGEIERVIVSRPKDG